MHLKKLNQKKLLQKIVIISLLLLTSISCKKNINFRDEVASVDGKDISKDLYTKELTFYSSYLTKKYGENYLSIKDKSNKTNYEILEKELLDSLIKDQLMLNDLKENNFTINNIEFENLEKELIRKLKSKESLKANIEAINSDELSFSDALFRDSIKFEHKKMFNKISGIKDKEIINYFNRNSKLQKLYKYNALVFDDKLEAEKISSKIKNNQNFRSVMKKDVRNFKVITSDFVYEDDEILRMSGINKKDSVSNIFEYENKYFILMINSYNENENDLLIRAKKYYLDLKYNEYLKKLIKKANIKVFV